MVALLRHQTLSSSDDDHALLVFLIHPKQVAGHASLDLSMQFRC